MNPEKLREFFLSHFSSFDILVFSLNLFIFLFSKRIVATYPGAGQGLGKSAARLWALRALNGLLFLLYFIAFWFAELARPISQTGLTLLLSYLAVHFFHRFTIKRFGRTKDVGGEILKSETYQSSMFGLVGFLVVATCAFLFIINIWNITNWLRATSVFGGLLIIAFSTKDVWAPENINGLILLYNDNVQPGSVVKVDEFNLLGVVVQTTMTQTVFYDLRMRHQILLPNSKFRDTKVEVLNNSPSKGIRRFIDFKIGYGAPSLEVEQFLKKVWDSACQSESAINRDYKPRIRLKETGDHAVTWRLFFSVTNPYRVLEAEFAVNRAAYDLSLETGMGLDTPFTHRILEINATSFLHGHVSPTSTPNIETDHT